MKQTPIHDQHNPDLLNFIPITAKKIIEVGCSSGALAREYKKLNTNCHYLGIDIDAHYTEFAQRYCDSVLSVDIEGPNFNITETGKSVDCWLFGDTLEHFRDPWNVLSNIRKIIPNNGCIVACIPNAQHWSIQAKLNTGDFRYEDSGLLDRTHLRWFTRTTIFELFESTGYRIEDGMPRVFGSNQPNLNLILESIKKMALSLGVDPDVAVEDAMPLQYVVRAIPI
jgi:SAM-dependent methyltransferase